MGRHGVVRALARAALGAGRFHCYHHLQDSRTQDGNTVINFFQFAILGLGLSSAYVLLGNGLVTIYRGSGVLNFAHGAYAMATAYAFYELNQVQHWPYYAAFLAALVFIAVVGVLTHVLVMRPLRHASPLSRLIATLGLLLLIEGVATLKYGATFLRVPTELPTKIYHLGSVTVPVCNRSCSGSRSY